MRGVVERPQQPVPHAELHDPRHGAVVGVDEGERARLGHLAAQLADHAAVQHGGAGAAGADRGEHRVEAGADPRGERLHRLRARDDVPALLHQRAHGDRVALVHAPPVLAALPLAEVDLAQVLDHLRLQARGTGQRLGGLVRPLERRHEQRAQRLAVEALRDGARLLAALGGERRVAVALDELEGLARLEGGRGAVADHDQLRGVGRDGERALAIGLVHRPAHRIAGSEGFPWRRRCSGTSSPSYA